MKLFLVSATLATLAYFTGVAVGEKGKAETVKVVSGFALSFGYVCGAFRDPACLDDYKQQ